MKQEFIVVPVQKLEIWETALRLSGQNTKKNVANEMKELLEKTKSEGKEKEICKNNLNKNC